MKFKTVSLLSVVAACIAGCASEPITVSPVEVAHVARVADGRTDRGIESAFRALPSAADGARQPAHYQHVYVDSLGTQTVATIPLRDAVENNILASDDTPVQRFDLDPKKLHWVVLDSASVRPSSIEGVGGVGIGKENFSEVNFNLNETEIINPDRLEKLAGKAQKVSGIFYIVGFADESGIESSNLVLSKERADSVAAWLGARGIHSSRIHGFGAGISRFYQGLDLNRRATVSFVIQEPTK